MSSGNDGEQEYRFQGFEDKSDGRISNELNDESVVGKFNLAVSNSELNQKEALEEALAQCITEDDRGLPTLKSDIVEGYEENNGSA